MNGGEKMTDEKQQDKNLRQKSHPQTMSFTTLVLLTGFIGGIFWSSLGYLAYIINLTDIHPNVILEPWTIGAWKEGWLGTIISIILIGIISIVAAFIYYSLLRKFPSIFVGVLYGVILFLVVFGLLNPMFPGISPLKEISKNTIITTVCLYILYGVFVGYTISYEESEIKYKKERDKQA